MPLPRIDNSIQNFFIHELTRDGLDEVDSGGINRLMAHCGINDTDAVEVTPRISAYRRSELLGLLNVQGYSAFLTLDGRLALEQRLGIKNAQRGGLGGQSVDMPEGSVTRVDLSQLPTNRLTAAFLEEVRGRRDIFENPTLSIEEKGKQLYLLFADYARALLTRPDKEKKSERTRLLLSLKELPAAHVFLLLEDSDGDGFANAFELAYGTKPGRPENVFPERLEGWSTYQNMHGSFREIAVKLDGLLAAMGRPARVEEHERRSAVAWLMGEKPGNTIVDRLRESQAIGSTGGLDFVRGLFPPSHPVWSLELEDHFEIAVDFLDAAGGFVSFHRDQGDRMAALHKESGERVEASHEEVRSETDGQTRYRPVFKDARGAVVPSRDVKLVILDAQGRVKGDGKTDGEHETGWWGFCDRNALNQLVTTRFGYPAPDQSVSVTAADQTVTFKAGEVLDIVGRRLTEIFRHYEYTGFRYDNELDVVELKDGTRLFGRLDGNISLARPDVTYDGDRATLSAQGSEDPFRAVASQVLREVAPGERGEDLEAISPAGERYLVRAADIPGGFVPSERRPVAWSLGPSARQKLTDLILPVAEARQVGPLEKVPAAEALRAIAERGLAALEADPKVDLAETLGDRTQVGRLLKLWSLLADGAPARIDALAAAFGRLDAVFKAHPSGAARARALEALTREDVVARMLYGRLGNIAHALRDDLGVVVRAEWRRASVDEKAERVFSWFDGSDAAKVDRVRASLKGESGLVGSLNLTFRTLGRDSLLQSVEAFRRSRELEALEQHTAHLRELREMLSRVARVVEREPLVLEDGAPARGVRSYELLPADPLDPEDLSRPRFSVSERGFVCFRLAYAPGGEEASPDLDALHRALREVVEGVRQAGDVASTREVMVFASPVDLPQKLELRVADGTTRTLLSTELNRLEREDIDDLAIEEIIAHVKRNDGVTNADSWQNEGVSNGLHIFSAVRSYVAGDRDAPAWIAELTTRPLLGRTGEAKDLGKIRFFDLGHEANGSWSSEIRGWVETDGGLVTNSGLVAGRYDFLWTLSGGPDWNAPPTFNPHVPNDLVLQLYVSSVKDEAKLEALATRGLLPEDWRKYRLGAGSA